jgi:hypothetical protein
MLLIKTITVSDGWKYRLPGLSATTTFFPAEKSKRHFENSNTTCRKSTVHKRRKKRRFS